VGSDSIAHCRGGELYGHMYNSERSPTSRESSDLTMLDFCLWGWMKREVDKRKVDARDELFVRILDAA